MKIVALDELDFCIEPYEWHWAKDNRADIDRHFARMREQRPQLWNGQVLVLNRWQLDGAKLSGTFFQTDFASFVCHRAFGFPDPNAISCFGGGALRTACGAYLLGIMASHTANAGRVYFPAGTPDLADVREGGVVDLAGSVIKELREEAGIENGDVVISGKWHAVFAGFRIALYLGVESPDSFDTLAGKIRGHIASEKVPELSDVVAVRSRADFSPAMPAFIRAYLDAMLPAEVK